MGVPIFSQASVTCNAVARSRAAVDRYVNAAGRPRVTRTERRHPTSPLSRLVASTVHEGHNRSSNRLVILALILLHEP